jgi:predicted secreted protein
VLRAAEPAPNRGIRFTSSLRDRINMTVRTRTTKTKASSLDAIAHSMREMVEAGAAYAHYRLPRGLELVLQRKPEPTGAIRWRLALGRSDVQRSADEITICQRAFAVPHSTEHTLIAKTRTNTKTGLPATWWIAEMYWYEA